MPATHDPTRPTRARRLRPVAAVAPLAFPIAAVLCLAGCKTSGSIATSDGAISGTPGTAVAHNPYTIDSILALATFDMAWELVYESHFDPSFNGVDWPAVRDELRPRVETLDDERDLRAVIEDMLSRLDQSHFALLPREAVNRLENGMNSTGASDEAGADQVSSGERDHAALDGDSEGEFDDDPDREGDLGLKIALIDNEVVITSVDEGGPAGQAGVRSGWVIDEVDGRNLSTRFSDLTSHGDDRMALYHAMAMVIARLHGQPDTSVDLVLRDEQDTKVEVELTRRQRPGELVKFGNLPPMNANLEHERLVASDGAQIGLIRFSVWMIPLSAPFGMAIDDLRDADGMVLDLRGNPGGVGGMAMGFAGHFVNESSSLGTMKMRTGELKFIISPRRVSTNGDRVDPFTGPLAILVDRYTASTSEIFSAGMQVIGRARVFGETSAGAALPAQMNQLPNGDVLLHAFADFILPNGESVEGTGVVPDTIIELSRKDLIGGRDPVLEAAIDWIVSQSQHKNAAALIAE
jgi:carboxyl-terminal processing protease